MNSSAQPLILVVDDSPTSAHVLLDCLEAANYRVLIAQSGESALEKLKWIAPELILLDVVMAGMDGFETCRRLKASEVTRAIPVIFMTALSDVTDKVKGFSLGAIDYITKPLQPEEVLARVNVHLQIQTLNRKLQDLNQTLEQRVSDRTAELAATLEQLQQSQLQLVQSEKMSALGQMVAGVAHEINNPIGFIAGNLQPAQQYVQDLLELLCLYQRKLPNPGPEVEAKMAAINLTYLRDDLSRLLDSMQLGVERIRTISTSLRTFSRADQACKVAFNIHDGLDSTLLILKHRLRATPQRPAIKVIRKYGTIPLVDCFPGRLNQVFMNILANAIDAIEEANQSTAAASSEERSDRITIQTSLQDDQVLVQIMDTGIGMTQAVQSHIFDYLFTTKPADKGTGLGLAIARQIIYEQHQGTIESKSIPGQGSEFAIALPVKGG